MRRLIPFLLAAVMASFPPSLLLVFIGGLASTVGPNSCTHHGAAGCGVAVDVGGFAGSSPTVVTRGVAHAVPHTAYVYPSHYPMVATTASIIVASTMSGSGGKRSRSGRGNTGGLVQLVSADWTEQQTVHSGAGTPRQSSQPLQQGQPQPSSSSQQLEFSSLKEIANHHAELLAQERASSASSSSGNDLNSKEDKVVAEAPPDTLKVSVLGASRGKSPECTYSFVEFSNTHHTDTIVVHSTYIEPTTVFNDFISKNHPTMPTTSSLPPTLQGVYNEDRQLHIPPRTAVTVPVSIIPHWRKPPDLELQEGMKHFWGDFGYYRNDRGRYRKLDSKDQSGNSSSKSSSSASASASASSGQDDHASLLNSIGSAGLSSNTTSQAIHADLLDILHNTRAAQLSGYLHHDTNMAGYFLDTLLPNNMPSFRRTALLDASTVHETLVANTSWGFVQMKVPYICSPQISKEYEFGLPNNLMFLDGGGGWYARRNTTPTVELSYLFGDWKFNPTRDAMDPFVYRVYMNNPTSKELKIWEVYVTSSKGEELVDVEMQMVFDTCTWTSRQKKGRWFNGQSLTNHSPKKNNIYVATLRLNPDNFTREMSYQRQDLGFLEIRTNQGTFRIALDYIPNGGRGGVIHGVGENMTTLDTVHLVRDHFVDNLLWGAKGDANSTSMTEHERLPPSPNMTITKSYRAKDPSLPQEDTGFRIKHTSSPTSVPDFDWNETSSYMRATPSKINFGSITTGSRMIRIPIQLTNLHLKPLRIMRISVSMSTHSDDGLGNIMDISNETKFQRMEIGIDLKDGTSSHPTLLNRTSDDFPGAGLGSGADGSRESYVFLHDVVLPGGTVGPESETYDVPLYVWCRFNAADEADAKDGEKKDEETKDPVQMARFYTGSIIIRAYEQLLLYGDYEMELITNLSSSGSEGSNPSSSRYILEIPFSGSVLPGNLGSPTESLLFPTQFFVLPVEERVKIMSQQYSSSIHNGKVPEYYDRELDITNNFAVPIQIRKLRILDSNNNANDVAGGPGNGNTDDGFCSTRFSTNWSFDNVNAKSNNHWPWAKKGTKWKGLTIRYYFQKDDAEYHFYGDYKKCILSIETDRAGKQSLPLIIYGGEVVVDIERPEGGQLTVHCLVTKKDGTKDGMTVVSKSGMPCMKDWISATREGVMLKNSILKMGLDRENRAGGFKKISRKACIGNPITSVIVGDWEDQVEYYFRSLLSTASSSKGRSSAEQQALQPVVLSLGAIETGKSMSRSIQLTNLNHASIDVTATSASVGNMSVRVGILPSVQDLNDALHSIQQKQLEGGTNDVAYFLQNSPYAKEFFDKFRHKFDIVPSARAHGSELLNLFQRPAVVDTFHNATEYLTNYIDDKEKLMDCTRGFMLAADGTYSKEYKSRKVGKKSWTIPPGGSARFLVTVHAPERSELQNDVTPFVGSGLVLETNHGQAFPIVVTYSVIAGQLQLRPDADANVTTYFDNADNEEMSRRLVAGEERMGQATSTATPSSMTVIVPLTFKDPTLTPSVDNFAQRKGVPISIESTFSQDVYLSEIRSCNKWFNVFLPSNNAAAREFFSKQGPSNYLRVRGKKIKQSSTQTTELTNKTVLPLGKVLSALSCSHPSGDTSFYSCALAWLENRDTLQPQGCGMDEVDMSKDDAETLVKRIATTKSNAIGALRDVVAFLSVRYVDIKNEDGSTSATATSGKSSDGGGSDKSGGYIHFSRIHMFEHARRMWNEVVSLKLNTITGHINAKTVYFTDHNSESAAHLQHIAYEVSSQPKIAPPLSIPVSSVLLRSTIEIPKLFWDQGGSDDGGDDAQTAESDSQDAIGIVDFGTVHVADTAMRYVPISNPTAMTIRIRLAAIDSLDGSFGKDSFSQKNVFVQGGPADKHSWWTGGSYWMSDDNDGHLVSASHNVTIKSGAGAYVSLLNPALHTMTAFVLGCGKRCGLRTDQDNNGDEKSFSPIGAASGSDSALFGRPHDDVYKSTSPENRKSPKKALGINDPPSFSLGRIGNEIVLPPYGTAELGPVYFRPPGRGDHKGTIYIENSLTGFEEVEIRGRGGWENLVFLDPLPNENNDGDVGGDVEFRFGKSALVFPGSHKLAEKAPLQKPGGPVIKSVRLANHGDVPVDISRIYMASSEVMHFTHKRQHPTSSFGNTAADSSVGDSHEQERRRCSARGFVLPGCADPSHSNAWIDKLLLWLNDFLDSFLVTSPSPDEHSTRAKYSEEAEAFYKDGFTLQPNQTQSVYVLHYPDCTFQTSYASMIFEIGGRKAPTGRDRGRVGSWQQTFRKRRVELLVGYDMSASEFRHCVPYSPPESSISIWERKIVFQLPTLLHDVLSFGLTRLTDANGNPYIRRKPIEVTLMAASFILLLFALSLDLIFTVEISAIRKSCPSWKPTCRCLARADPTSSDLVSIGKEQTKHVLLSRFKKEAVLPSNCIQSDGSFGREKKAGLNVASGTHSEAIFDRLNVVNESKMTNGDCEENEALGLLPCGLGWRTALRRGVGLPSSPKNDGSSELEYLKRTRDMYLKKQREKQNATPVRTATPTVSQVSPMPIPPTKTHGTASRINGYPHVASKPINAAATVARSQPQARKVEQPQIKKNHQVPSATNGSNALATPSRPRPAPQSKPSDITDVRSVASKGPPKSSISDRAGGKTSSAKVNTNVESAKQLKQKANTTGGASSNVVQTDQKSIKVADTKGKTKQRNEAKTAKKTETENDTPRQEESSSKPKSVSNQKARSTKPAVEISSSGSSSKSKQDETTITSPSRPAAAQAKQARAAKKATNGTKSAEQSKGNKQGKQKGASKKATTKNTPKSPVSTTEKSTTAKPAQSDAEFPPLSSAAAATPAQPPTPNNRSKKTAPQQIANAVRPPPGLLAPPGFLDQPDSNPSSPASSPQRLLSSSSHRSPMVQHSMPQEIPGIDIIHSPPLMNNDFMTSLALMGGNGVGRGNNPLLESSLFPTQSNDNSPRSGSGSSSALSIPPFRPQSFTPPTLEPSATTETSSEVGAPADVQALLGLGSDFNVSNFLDGLGIKIEAPKPVEAPEPLPVQANPFAVSLDPWNSIDNSTRNTSNNPLAALRGVAVSHEESPIIAGIPLNSNAPSLLATSSTLQNSATTASTYAEPAYASIVSDDGGRGDDDFLEPDSFYNQLLGED